MGILQKGEKMQAQRKLKKMIGIGSLFLFLLGCSRQDFIVYEDSSEEVLQESEAEIIQIQAGEEKEEASTEDAGELTEEAVREIAVHICGAVNQPGVYLFTGTPRVYEGIEKAGGFREDAKQDYLNLALFLEDGMKVMVPTIEQAKQWETAEGNEASGMGKVKEVPTAKEQESSKGKVNINTADITLLCTLSGIGESRAKSIITYREKHGEFQKIEDIMQISGIKEAAFEKIKDEITVK